MERTKDAVMDALYEILEWQEECMKLVEREKEKTPELHDHISAMECIDLGARINALLALALMSSDGVASQRKNNG